MRLKTAWGRSRGELFPNGCAYPCDPAGEAEEVINCRCVAIPGAGEINACPSWDQDQPHTLGDLFKAGTLVIPRRGPHNPADLEAACPEITIW